MTRPRETNAAGKMRLRGLEGIGQPKVRIAVQAEGLAPELRTVELLEPKTTLDISLRPPQVFRGRVVDEYGVPIPNAVVRTDTDNHGIRSFEWVGQTDADGRFKWNSAPSEPVLFWFEAEGGYEALRDLPLVPDGREYEITLLRKAP
jgi:hypothetical protein